MNEKHVHVVGVELLENRGKVILGETQMRYSKPEWIGTSVFW
jgi:hypothetical protein